MIDGILVFFLCILSITLFASLIIYFIFKRDKARSKKKKDENKFKRFIIKYDDHVRKKQKLANRAN
jgi:hypothetical protein